MAEATTLIEDTAARTTEGVAALANPDDGYGCFGRDALDVATKVDIEHRVADDGDAAVLGSFEKSKDSIAAERMRHDPRS